MRWIPMGMALLIAAGPACKGDEPTGASSGPGSTPPPVAPAKLSTAGGKVSVKRATADDWREATPGTELFTGDKVRTEAGAKASLTFLDGSTVSLAEDALIAIGEGREGARGPSTLTVLKGRIDASLEDAQRQSLTVSTPSATVRAGREIVFQ